MWTSFWWIYEFEVFIKMSSSRLCLAIPMLEIAIKHLKVFLFVRFLKEEYTVKNDHALNGKRLL